MIENDSVDAGLEATSLPCLAQKYLMRLTSVEQELSDLQDISHNDREDCRRQLKTLKATLNEAKNKNSKPKRKQIPPRFISIGKANDLIRATK